MDDSGTLLYRPYTQPQGICNTYGTVVRDLWLCKQTLSSDLLIPGNCTITSAYVVDHTEMFAGSFDIISQLQNIVTSDGKS